MAELDCLIQLAEGLKYDKLMRLKALRQERAPFGARTKSKRQLARSCLAITESSVTATSSIFFLPGAFFELSPFGSNIHYFGMAGRKRSANYILYGPELTEKFLRRLFTGIELVLFKISHIVLENQKRTYHFETEKAHTRLNRLQPFIDVPNWVEYRKDFDELFFVRNAFAHSFVDLEDIRYRGYELRECFGITYLGRSYNDAESEGARMFIADAELFLNPLLDLFIKSQFLQIDREKFFKLCDQLLKRRSLSR